MNSRDEEAPSERSGKSQTHKLLSLWSWGTPPSQNVDVSTHPEALQILYFCGFYGDLIAWA